MAELRLDLSALISVAVPLAAVAVAWGGLTARLDSLREDIAGLERSLDRERSERLQHQTQATQQWVTWLLARPGTRLDPSLRRHATGGRDATD